MMTKTSMRYAVAALAACTPALVAVPSDAAQAAPPECKGHPVTIGGTSGDDRIVGTPRRDVIRTGQGDDTIRSRAGNDIVCADRGADVLIGGRGRDRLDGGPFKVIDVGGEETGARADRFVGGSGNDQIMGGGSPANEIDVMPEFVTPDRVAFPEARGGITITRNGVVRGAGVGRDRLVGIQQVTGTKWADRITIEGEHIVRGKGGADRVDVVAGKRDRQLWPKVDAGTGNDRVDLSRHRDPYFEVEGGAGTDRMIGSPERDWLFDRSGAGVVRGGATSDQIGVTSRMTVHGGDGNDQLSMGVRKGSLGSVDGGSGNDKLGFPNRPHLPMRIDLPAGTFEAGSHAGDVRRVERFGLPAVYADATFVGTDGPDRLSSNIGKGQTLRAKLGGGGDRLETDGTYINGAGTAVTDGGDGNDTLDGGIGETVVRFFGGDGDDTIQGGLADDTLKGGPGEDTADGFDGDDLCRAEQVSRCER